MLSTLAVSTRKFSDDEKGSVGILFGLMSVAVLFLAGMAIDYGRILDVRAKITSAADAAVLAAGRALRDGDMTESEIEALAKAYFQENAKRVSKAGKVGTPAVVVDRDRGAVSLDVNTAVAMTLTRLGGIKTVNVPVTTEAVFESKNIEVGMALDITGSMNSAPAAGGDLKIDSLKLAFEKFANKLLPDQQSSTQNIRIGFAPYSSAINLGDYAEEASLDRSKDGCVTERSGGAFTDAAVPNGAWGAKAPTDGAFLVKADGAKDVDPTEDNPFAGQYVCPSAQIRPLSKSRTALIDEVNSFKASGHTSGHFGAQWAWNLVSDQWGGVWGSDSAPASYSEVDKGKLIKAVVLMTDGSFNTAYHYGKSSKQAVELCTEMKKKGVVVFSVAFDAPAAAKKTLEACATDTDDYFADASNGAELEAAFQKFASVLTELRISK